MKDNNKEQFFNELGFFTLCNAAPELGKFFKDTITISSPKTELMLFEEVFGRMDDSVFTTIKFNDGDKGETHVFFKKEDALKLVKYALDKRFKKNPENVVWDRFSINVIEEVINILGGNMTEILSVVYGEGIEIDVPEVKEFDGRCQIMPLREAIVLNTFTLYLGGDGLNLKMYELAKQSYYEEVVFELKNRL